MKKGSKWRKWDLHFHTPSSYDYQDKSVTNQEIIDTLFANRVEAVAITDHHVIDIDRIKELQRLSVGKLTILPGIEFRAELGGSESVHFIGIFPEKSDIDHIWVNIQSQCNLTIKSVSDQGGQEKIHCDLKDTCALIHLLGGIVSVHAGAKTNTIENITNALPYKMALKKDLVINHIDLLELGTESDQIDYIDKVFPAISHQLPMILCSDNHNAKNYIIKKNCWLKGDPTFEGLKQIIYEPCYRIYIAEHPPIDPPIRINHVSFDFPDKAKFEEDFFCLAGKNDLYFSPNFTCLIGGRGTGKSTILNLIHERLRPGENQFFRNKKIKNDHDKQILISDSVTIDGDTDEKYIEFLSQNEIEEFARDYSKLTASVYSRITKRDEEGLIVEKEQKLNEQTQKLNEHIFDKINVNNLKTDLFSIQKELGANQKIIESFSSAEYLKINTNLKEVTENLSSIKQSKDTYDLLIKELNELIIKFKPSDKTNLYNDQVEKIISEIKELRQKFISVDFQEVEKEILALEIKLSEEKINLTQYLATKGLTEENQKDIANANINTTKIERKLADKKAEIEKLQSKIDNFNIETLISSNIEYQEELFKHVKRISDVLENSEGTSIKPISLFFEFDEEKAKEEIFSDFKIAFESKIARSNHKGDSILKDILFCVQPNKLNDHSSFLDKLTAFRTTSAAKAFLIEIFSDKSNFDIYKLIATLNLSDFSSFKKAKVQYDGRPIENSSFGQRCTAVLVILLLLGNNPIIIDEPEAHLDSLLISDYLVEIIKERKSNRQVIFATHNANFVINGDAELIHILSINGTNRTTAITSTTIENLETREGLIQLEGGREAFKKRESRYQ